MCAPTDTSTTLGNYSDIVPLMYAGSRLPDMCAVSAWVILLKIDALVVGAENQPTNGWRVIARHVRTTTSTTMTTIGNNKTTIAALMYAGSRLPDM